MLRKFLNDLLILRKKIKAYLVCDVSIKHLRSIKIVGHPVGIVIARKAIIKKGLIISPNVVIGAQSDSDRKYPVIEENVRIYANSVIIGDIRIGKNAIIGAGSFINKDIPANHIAYTKKELIIKMVERKKE